MSLYARQPVALANYNSICTTAYIVLYLHAIGSHFFIYYIPSHSGRVNHWILCLYTMQKVCTVVIEIAHINWFSCALYYNILKSWFQGLKLPLPHACMVGENTPQYTHPKDIHIWKYFNESSGLKKESNAPHCIMHLTNVSLYYWKMIDCNDYKYCSNGVTIVAQHQEWF